MPASRTADSSRSSSRRARTSAGSARGLLLVGRATLVGLGPHVGEVVVGGERLSLPPRGRDRVAALPTDGVAERLPHGPLAAARVRVPGRVGQLEEDPLEVPAGRGGRGDQVRCPAAVGCRRSDRCRGVDAGQLEQLEDPVEAVSDLLVAVTLPVPLGRKVRIGDGREVADCRHDLASGGEELLGDGARGDVGGEAGEGVRGRGRHRSSLPASKIGRYSSAVGDYSKQEAAERAGVSPDLLGQLVEIGILEPSEGDRFSIGDVRRVVLLDSFVAAGIPLEGLATQIRKGDITLAFLDSPAFDSFATFAPMTFGQLSATTGVPVDLLMVIREAIGAALPTPDDRVREDEMAIVPLVEAQLEAGLKPATIERALRAIGDSMRRAAQVEADWFRSEIIEPRAAGKTGAEIGAIAIEFRARFTPLNDQARLAIHHAHEAHAVTSNLVDAWERELANAGLMSRLERPPAMCFLDITGFTRLTQERGDTAAADVAEQLGRTVTRISVKHGGRPVKWLGDGVMFFFRDPGRGVAAALEMLEGLAEAGLPPAHVGLHAGPVIFQEGDYYGQTVNVAARIAEYARPGEVIVSQAVVDASAAAGASFTEIGPVELKGVVGAMRLHAAHRSDSDSTGRA